MIHLNSTLIWLFNINSNDRTLYFLFKYWYFFIMVVPKDESKSNQNVLSNYNVKVMHGAYDVLWWIWPNYSHIWCIYLWDVMHVYGIYICLADLYINIWHMNWIWQNRIWDFDIIVITLAAIIMKYWEIFLLCKIDFNLWKDLSYILMYNYTSLLQEEKNKLLY